jgi:hypothetical protein
MQVLHALGSPQQHVHHLHPGQVAAGRVKQAVQGTLGTEPGTATTQTTVRLRQAVLVAGHCQTVSSREHMLLSCTLQGLVQLRLGPAASLTTYRPAAAEAGTTRFDKLDKPCSSSIMVISHSLSCHCPVTPHLPLPPPTHCVTRARCGGVVHTPSSRST